MKKQSEFNQYEQAAINRATNKSDRAKKLDRDKLEKISQAKREKKS